MAEEKDKNRVPKDICDLAKDLALLIDRIDNKNVENKKVIEGAK